MDATALLSRSVAVTVAVTVTVTGGAALFRAEAERTAVERFEGNQSSSEISPSPNITERLYIITVERNSCGYEAAEEEEEDSSEECTVVDVTRMLDG